MAVWDETPFLGPMVEMLLKLDRQVHDEIDVQRITLGEEVSDSIQKNSSLAGVLVFF